MDRVYIFISISAILIYMSQSFPDVEYRIIFSNPLNRNRAGSFETDRFLNMAHIADYMVDAASSVGLNNLIARELSVSPTPQDIVCHSLRDQAGSCSHYFQRSESPATEERKKYIWRMHQPSEAPRKYSIFPFKDRLSIGSGRQSPSPESTLSLPLGEKHNTNKPKELNKRRKPSITELGPMTTVHEVAMDSRECCTPFGNYI